MNNNENSSVCTSCGGACCKGMPGSSHPLDFKEITVDVLIEKLKNGYCFDYWEGKASDDPQYEDKTAYYLRPSTTRGLGKIVDASWGGACNFLTDKGCPLSFEERPSQCRALVPDPEPDMHAKDCKWLDGYSKKDIAVAWLPYNEIIVQAINKLQDERNVD